MPYLLTGAKQIVVRLFSILFWQLLPAQGSFSAQSAWDQEVLKHIKLHEQKCRVHCGDPIKQCQTTTVAAVTEYEKLIYMDVTSRTES